MIGSWMWVGFASPQNEQGFSYTGWHVGMFEKVLRLTQREDLYQDGSWNEHFGDGCLFGPSFDVQYGLVAGSDEHMRRGKDTLTHNAGFVEEASQDLFAYNDELEVFIDVFAQPVTSGSTNGNRLCAIDPLLQSLDTISLALGDYFEPTVGEFATASYGPTSVRNFLTINHIERAAGYEENSEHHFERARTMTTAIHDVAWDEELGTYRFVRELYPNITFMLSYARMYPETGADGFLEAFYRTYDGTEPLSAVSGDHFHSPYGFESMGATDEDYSTFSSQNYLLLALLSAYQSTGNKALLDEVDTILTFIEIHLMEGDLITRHWIDGRAASHHDPWYFCMGCNVQTLYILVVREMIRMEEQQDI